MALLGRNIDEVTFEGLRRESDFRGAPTHGIGPPGNTKVLRFDVNVVKEHIKCWIKERPQDTFMGADDLRLAVKNGVLRPGQLIFQEVPLAHHEGKDGYLGWIYNLFCPLLTGVFTRQARYFAYFHVSVYVGGSYVVENGGFDDKYGYGSVALRSFEEAFAEEVYGTSRYFLVSPPKDKQGKSTRYLVCQKALAAIGVRFRYHMKAVNCETFATAMLGNIDEIDFTPIQTEIIRSHKKNFTSEQENEKLRQNLSKFRKFHRDLYNQILKVPHGIILSLEYYLNRPNKSESPWFMQMIDSYQYFFNAAKNGNAKKCISLFNMGLISSSRGKDGYTVLMYAVHSGNIPLCIELIQNGADINLKNRFGNTALIHASFTGNLPICNELLDLLADLDHQNKNGKNALMIAAGRGHSAVCKELIKRGTDVNLTDKYGNTALMYSVEENHIEICEQLVRNGANTNIQNDDGETTLMIAAREGHLDMCCILCQYGEDNINYQDIYKNTALMHAVYEGQADICAELIRNGADVNMKDKQGNTPLFHASYEGNISVCNELMKGSIDINARNNLGRSALMYAAQEGHTSLCTEMIKRGADVNQTNAYGRNVLMYAAREGHYTICVELLCKGASVNMTDVDGCTAFMVAAQAGHRDVCAELFKYGADVNIKNKQGNTALILSHESVFEQIRNYVISTYASNC